MNSGGSTVPKTDDKIDKKDGDGDSTDNTADKMQSVFVE